MGFDFTPDLMNTLEKGVEKIGDGVNWAGDKAADVMDGVGLEGGADWVREASGSVANRLGSEVAELELGQTDDPHKLIYGSAGKLRSTVSHLNDFQKAFGKVARGLKGLDSSHWRGEAADAFREKLAGQPKRWFKAQDAFEKAAGALTRFAETVEWAQGQAREAIEEYRLAEKATEKARSAHDSAVAEYNSAAQAYNAAVASNGDPGPRPKKPAEFSDPGASGRKNAQETLDQARRRRDEAAETARDAIRAARDAAPHTPSFGRQLLDGAMGLELSAAHFGAGAVKGLGGIIGSIRGANPVDPYNLAHPDEYAMNLNSTAAGLVTMANDPAGAGRTMLADFMKDPEDWTGRLLPDVIATRGAGAAKGAVGVLRRAGRLSKVRERLPGREHLGTDGPEMRDTPPGKRCSDGTDPVDLATGKMYLPQTDIVLPGALPLVFSRHLESGFTGGHWFGPSWMSTADQRLEVDAEGVVFLSEDGLLLSYPHPVPGVPTLPVSGPRHSLARTRDGGYTLTDPETGHIRHFSPPSGGGEDGGKDGGEDGIALIEQITDRAGDHWITFDRAEDGTPTGLVHSAGYHLKLTTEDGRITALSLAGAAEDGSDQQLLRYDYTDGNLTAVTNSSGFPLRFAYDDRHRVVSWTDTNDRRYDYAYDDQDRCISEGGTEGHLSVRIAYDETDPETGHRITALTDSLGHTTRYVVNDHYKIVAEIGPTGAVSRTARDTLDRVVAATDPLGHTTAFEYDAAGRVTAVTRPDDSRATASYNALGLPTEVTDPDGATWRQTYDEAGRRISATDPSGATTTFTYDERGHLSTVTNALGHTTRVRCDAAGLPTEITDPLGGTTRYTRDPFGRVVTHTDPLGATTRYVWTVEGHLARRTAPDGATEIWTYDGEGNCLTHTDAAGGVTHFEYTHFDQLAARTDPNGVRYTFTYDTKLQLAKVTNPQGLHWSYAYDPAGALLSETDFDGRRITYARDMAGRLAARTSPLGDTTVYQYDKLGRTTAKRTADGTLTRYRYDANGRPLTAATPDCEVSWDRDALGRVTAETVNGRTMSYAYDPLGRRTHRRTPTGAEASYTYDAAGRRTSLTTSGRTLDFTHDAAGQEITRTLTDGLITLHQSWDATGRLASQSLYGAGSGTAEATGTGQGPLQQRTYAYRPDGYLTGVDDLLSGPRRFTLDPVGRVTRVSAHDWTETYAYDEAGNQTQAEWPHQHAGTEATGTRTYTGTRLTQAGRIRYEHDGAGRLTLRQKRHLSGKRETWHYTWDTEDRLTSVTTPDGTVWRYLYDPLGRRTAKQRLSPDGKTVLEQVTFTWDGTTLTEQTTSAGETTPAVTLTWDHNGLTPIAQTERRTAAEAPQHEIDSRFFAIITDLVGTPTELVSPEGQIAWRTRTTLWGTTTWNADATAYTPLRFPGQYFDPETGLHYNYFRYYDPGTCRYASPDPFGLAPAPNPTLYVHNPHTWTDRLGLAPDYEDSVPIYRTPKGAHAEHELINGPDPANHQPGIDIGGGIISDGKIYFGEHDVAAEYAGPTGKNFAKGMVRYDMHPSFLEEFGQHAKIHDWNGLDPQTGRPGKPRLEFEIPVDKLDRFNELTRNRSWIPIFGGVK
ncbi:putative T7SS-secreted protein [Streptomyces olivaceiscleroticus]|uniref:Type IV secretion protein Rhs n=1 Tax=Streptomyces olivaceiscleroticus TaxID=68245 RepID=A0ABP3J8F5_9ACTN